MFFLPSHDRIKARARLGQPAGERRRLEVEHTSGEDSNAYFVVVRRPTEAKYERERAQRARGAAAPPLMR